MISDIPFNWRRAKIGLACTAPSIAELTNSPVIPFQTGVYLPWGIWGDDVINVRDWLRENTAYKAIKLYGRFEWTRKQFETTRKLIGLTFEFENPFDLVHFKLRWR